MSILIPVKTRTLVKDISKELKVFFPKIYFNIKTTQEYNKTIITISYIDSVSKARVRNITRQFPQRYSAGRNTIKVNILIDRQMSHEVQSVLLSEMKTVFKINTELNVKDWFEPTNEKVETYLQKIFNIRDF
ncbi:hypothetical protein [Dysgonomonas sp. ZJ709]|uniref:hypothetical protein n=1 Tax=Dysgonomonas sp. ZJ709 TaxID=2709797 RepID=UPI0013EA2DD0|nr:hypothetical protein [Dysgonomonas sp. ZJ709]